MSNRNPLKRVLTMQDLDLFSVQELALVYLGQSSSGGNVMMSYYDSKYYDSHYYDSHYYDSKYYDSHYYERGSGYDTDAGGRKYGDSSYSDRAGC